MALVEKSVSDVNSSFLSWLCCLPCRSVAALVCLLGCQCGQAEQCVCGPYLDDKLEKMAETITSHATSYTKQAPHEKIRALQTEQWDATYIFNSAGILNPLHHEIYNQVQDSVLNILNTYNFGIIKSQDLNSDELKVIGKMLKERIFSRLPSKEDFEKRLQETAGFATNDVDKRNRCLTNCIKEIANHDFIREQLNLISEQIETCRKEHKSAKALLSSSRSLFAVNTNANAKSSINLLVHDVPLPPPPPARQLQR